MELTKFEKELKKINNPGIKRVADYLLTRTDIHKNLEKENKSLNEMWNYIISEAQRVAVDKCAALDDDTVFGWAVHYYDEDDIKVSSKTNHVKVAVSDDSKEIEKYKKEAKAKDEEIQKLKAQLEKKDEPKTMVPPKKEKKVKQIKPEIFEGQLSLFEAL